MQSVILLLAAMCGSQPASDGSPALAGWPKLNVVVLDPDGQPVSGARVSPWGLRSSRGHGFWLEELHGEPPEVITNQDGRATFSYPKFARPNAETKSVTVNIEANEFCLESVDLSVPQADPVTLRRGTRLRIAVTEADGRTRVPDAHLIVSHDSLITPLFEKDADGWYRSRPLPPKKNWLFAVEFSDSGPRFSPPVEWEPGDPETHEFVLPVELGIRVEGRLDDSVPRPVRNGRVVVRCTNPVMLWRDCDWEDIVEIAADGTFVFRSLPRDGDLQLIAVCDGFVSKSPSEAEIAATDIRYGGEGRVSQGLHYPQVFAADGDVVRPTVEMELTGECWIRIVDPEGTPVPDLGVRFQVTQRQFPFATSPLGSGYRSSDTIRNRVFDPIGQRAFIRNTDREGIVKFNNLPLGDQLFGIFDSQHNVYVFNGDEHGRLTISADNRAELTVALDEEPQLGSGAQNR